MSCSIDLFGFCRSISVGYLFTRLMLNVYEKIFLISHCWGSCDPFENWLVLFAFTRVNNCFQFSRSSHSLCCFFRSFFLARSGNNLPVWVRTASGNSSVLLFAYQAPTISKILPASGVATSGGSVTLLGANFVSCLIHKHYLHRLFVIVCFICHSCCDCLLFNLG